MRRRSTREPRGSGGEAAGRHLHDRQAQAGELAAGGGQLLGRHLLEVLALQLLAGGPGEERVDLDRRLLLLLGLGLARPLLGRHRLGDATAHLLLLGLGLVALELRQEELHHALEELRVAPEDVEALVEQLALVAPVHEHGVQRPVEILAPLEADGLQRAKRLDHAARADRQAGGAERAGEVHDVAGEAAAAAPGALAGAWCVTSLAGHPGPGSGPG